MLIACPSCNAGYDVPDDRLRPGRTVKCARCGGTWTPIDTPAPPETAPEPSAIAPPGPEPALDTPEPPPGPEPDSAPPPPPPPVVAAPPPRTRPLLALAWLASAVLLAALLTLAVLRRDGIMQAWPPSQRAYLALGLAR